MYLRIVSRDVWTVLAVCSDERRCGVLDFMSRLQRDDPIESARLLRAVSRLATHGPPHNVRRSRSLAHGICELKTPGGVRLMYFFDEGRVVICTDAMSKPKSRGLAVAIERAAQTRWRYLNDKRRGDVWIMEDE
jgi:hypothetical protein